MARISGTAGADTYGGTDKDDSITGADGNDSLNGGGGADAIYGGNGNDTLDGGSINSDSLYGDAGDDRFLLTGSYGTDSIFGGETADSQADVIDASALTQGVTLNFTGAEAGTVTVTAATSSQAAFAGVERFVLTAQADVMLAGSAGAPVTVDAGAGNDSLTGSAVNDTLSLPSQRRTLPT